MTPITDSHIGPIHLVADFYALPFFNGATKVTFEKQTITTGNNEREAYCIDWIGRDMFPHFRILDLTGSWQFLFTTDSCSEEQAAKIVERFSFCFDITFMDYEDGNYSYASAVRSLKSLIKSKGLPEGNYALLLNQNK
jgi:hypothetical protein